MQGYAKVQTDNEVIDLMIVDIAEARKIKALGDDFIYRDEHTKLERRGLFFKREIRLVSQDKVNENLPITLFFSVFKLHFSRTYLDIVSICRISKASSDGFMYLGEDLCFTYNLYKNRVKGSSHETV
jgi:hypothetical protein